MAGRTRPLLTPLAGPVPDVTTQEEVPVQIVLTGSDDDGESLTFSQIDGPAHGDIGLIGVPACEPRAAVELREHDRPVYARRQ